MNRALLSLTAIACTLLAGCHASTTSQPATPATKPAVVATPPRPSVAPPAFRVFHHDASSVTLVTAANATDAQISALIWELHDAARAHSFDRIGIPQKLVDARAPLIWFHIYRGDRCASEKYTSGKLPCGASYHAAGDYTLGGFTNPNHDDGLLIHDEDHDTHLW